MAKELATIKDGNSFAGMLVVQSKHGNAQLMSDFTIKKVTQDQVVQIIKNNPTGKDNYGNTITAIEPFTVSKENGKEVLKVEHYKSPLAQTIMGYNRANLIRTQISSSEYMQYVDTQFRLNEIQKISNKKYSTAATVNMVAGRPGQREFYVSISLYTEDTSTFVNLRKCFMYEAKRSPIVGETYIEFGSFIQVTVPCEVSDSINIDRLRYITEEWPSLGIEWNPNCMNNFWDRYNILAKHSKDSYDLAQKFAPSKEAVAHVESNIRRFVTGAYKQKENKKPNVEAIRVPGITLQQLM